MTVIETTLTLPDPARPKFYRVELDGRRLTTAAWSTGRQPRTTVKDLDVADDHAAGLAFEKARDKKMREGFCLVSDAGEATRGDAVLELLVPNRSPADAFDLSPDGRTLVVGTTLDQAYGAEIHLVDIATGRRRLLHAEPPEIHPVHGTKHQTFLHAVLFDASGRRIVYALNGETRLLDVASGHTRTLASYRQFEDAQFNPFCVRPSWDRDRNRMLAFDTGDRVRVLDREWDTVCEVRVDGATRCCAAALSPSGRHMVLCHRGSGSGGAGPSTVEVWDVDQGAVLRRFPGTPLDRIAFDPTETLLVANPDPAQGPCAVSAQTGELAWHFPDEFRTDRWATCYAWEYSPDGKTLAIGRRGYTDVVDATTRECDPAFERISLRTGSTGRTYRVRISDDGKLLASGGDSGRIVVRTL